MDDKPTKKRSRWPVVVIALVLLLLLYVGSTVSVPPDFAEFMREVALRIAEGDESTILENYDGLQCECAFGGLFDVEGRRFGFSYVPDLGPYEERYIKGAGLPSWEIILTPDQIAAIASGSLTT